MSALENFNVNEPPQVEEIPFNAEAEQSVLGTILMDGKAIASVIDYLVPDDFYCLDSRTIYQAMTDLFKEQKAVDLVSVRERLKRMKATKQIQQYIGGLLNVFCIPSALTYHAQLVYDAAQERKVIKAGRELQALPSKCTSADEVFKKAGAIVSKLVIHEDRQVAVDLPSIMHKVYTDIETRYENGGELPGISSGYVDVDTITAGWKKGNLIIIAGRPAMGKTAFAICCAHNAAKRKGVPVAIFSLEMTKYELGERMLSREAEIDGGEMSIGKLQDGQWAEVSRALDSFSEWPITIFDQLNGISCVYQIEAKVRQLEAAGKKPEMVIVDYLQLLSSGTPDKRDSSRVLEVGEISRALKSLAQRLQVPVVALSSINRGVEQRQNKRPVLSDLRESGNIEQDADMVIFLYRDEYYNEDTDRKGEAEVIVSKNRHGGTGTAHLLFRPNMCAFYDRETPYVKPAVEDPKYKGAKGVPRHYDKDD